MSRRSSAGVPLAIVCSVTRIRSSAYPEPVRSRDRVRHEEARTPSRASPQRPRVRDAHRRPAATARRAGRRPSADAAAGRVRTGSRRRCGPARASRRASPTVSIGGGLRLRPESAARGWACRRLRSIWTSSAATVGSAGSSGSNGSNAVSGGNGRPPPSLISPGSALRKPAPASAPAPKPRAAAAYVPRSSQAPRELRLSPRTGPSMIRSTGSAGGGG